MKGQGRDLGRKGFDVVMPCRVVMPCEEENILLGCLRDGVTLAMLMAEERAGGGGDGELLCVEGRINACI